jgi:hypothetical protein
MKPITIVNKDGADLMKEVIDIGEESSGEDLKELNRLWDVANENKNDLLARVRTAKVLIVGSDNIRFTLLPLAKVRLLVELITEALNKWNEINTPKPLNEKIKNAVSYSYENYGSHCEDEDEEGADHNEDDHREF